MTEINLWKRRLGAVPESVWDDRELEVLILADNDLTEVSPRLGELARLRVLDLGHNRLAALPDVFDRLEGLTDFLYVHDNRLAGLPRSIASLARLAYLNAGENPLAGWPEAVSQLSGLAELRLAGCGLDSVPPSIGRLSRLHELHLRDNRIETLPDAIGDLRELRVLDLRGNPLRALPASIAGLPALWKLDLRWTPLDPPAWLGELAARGALVYR